MCAELWYRRFLFRYVFMLFFCYLNSGVQMRRNPSQKAKQKLSIKSYQSSDSLRSRTFVGSNTDTSVTGDMDLHKNVKSFTEIE